MSIDIWTVDLGAEGIKVVESFEEGRRVILVATIQNAQVALTRLRYAEAQHWLRAVRIVLDWEAKEWVRAVWDVRGPDSKVVRSLDLRQVPDRFPLDDDPHHGIFVLGDGVIHG